MTQRTHRPAPTGPEGLPPLPDTLPAPAPQPRTELPSARIPTETTAAEWLSRDRDAEEAMPVKVKPYVYIPGANTTISESAEALFKAVAPSKELFNQGGAVVQLIGEGDGHVASLVDGITAQSLFEKFVHFQKPTKSDTGMLVAIHTNITEAIAKQYLKSEACRKHLPKLNGILRCPLLVERGGKLHRMAQGYDTKTGFYVECAQEPHTIELEQAVNFLQSLLDDFHFVTPGDKSRAIASLLTPALKLGGLIKESVPIDVAEADASQSGKTYRQRMVAALYNQKPAVVTKKKGGVGSFEESFADHLVKGRVFIQFDNVRGKLDSEYLESFMTAGGTFSARIPYHGSIQVDPSKFIIFISSNGFEATKDLANRASIIRILRRENYNYRMHEGKDMLQMMFELQPLLIGCVFKIVEEWHRLGKQRTTETRHDFKEWCQVLDWIVQNIFHEAPLMDGHQDAKARAANPQLTWLRSVAIKVQEQNSLNKALSASAIAELCAENNIEIPNLAAEKQNKEEAHKQVGRIMSKLFGERNDLPVENYSVKREIKADRSVGGNDLKLKTYTFSIQGGTQTHCTAPAAKATDTPVVQAASDTSPQTSE